MGRKTETATLSPPRSPSCHPRRFSVLAPCCVGLLILLSKSMEQSCAEYLTWRAGYRRIVTEVRPVQRCAKISCLRLCPPRGGGERVDQSVNQRLQVEARCGHR